MPSLRKGCACAVYKHRTILGVTGKLPTIGDGAFVAPSAAVIGDVTLGKGASVWYGTVLRGMLLAHAQADLQPFSLDMHMFSALAHICAWVSLGLSRRKNLTDQGKQSWPQVTRAASE